MINSTNWIDNPGLKRGQVIWPGYPGQTGQVLSMSSRSDPDFTLDYVR